MQIEQKQNKIFKPQSIYTLAAEESNQVTTELENQIRAGGLTPSSSSLTQLRDSIKNVVDTAANNLQSQIDAITSASDVYDVVGTYAELQAYDTTDVPLNDIIKVLQDNTHNDAATYYRLVEVSGNKVWQYVGQEGPYYTKSEIDTDFALKSELPSIATVSQVGLIKPDNQSTFVGNDGTLTIASNVAAALPLFTPIWADHLLDDASYLRADTFSWQSGSVYMNAYNHLVNDIAGIAQSTETIGSYTITYYQANDGHKVVLADQETTVQNIFNESGVAWYYILDTANVRFKLPRTQYAFVGLRDTVGKYVPESLPNIKGDISVVLQNTQRHNSGALYYGDNDTADRNTNSSSAPKVSFDASLYSSTYQNNAPVQQRATQMYLYFYIGNFSQSATEQTAGLNSELFNNKMDVDGSNASVRFATYAELQELKNMMLGNIDWANKVNITINLTGGVAQNSYTCPSNGYLFPSMGGTGSTNALVNDTIVYTSGSSVSARTFTGELGGLIPVCKGDILSASKSSGNFSTTLIFIPQKQIEESGS